MNTDWDNTIQNMTQEQKKKFKTLSKKRKAFVIKGEQELMAKKNTTKKKSKSKLCKVAYKEIPSGWKTEPMKIAKLRKTSLGDNDSDLCGIASGFNPNYVPPAYEEVVHPAHYNGLPNGIECWDVTEHFPANIAMGMKHLWRAGLKPGNEAAKDLDKALQYIQRQKDLVTGKVNKM